MKRLVTFCVFGLFTTGAMCSSNVPYKQMLDDNNPLITGTPFKLNTDKTGTYVYVDGEKQYVQIPNDLKKEAFRFSDIITKGIKKGVIKSLSEKDRKQSMDSWIVFSYTNPENQVPVSYCSRHYPIKNYKTAFNSIFEKAHLEAQKELISIWGRSGYEYVVTEYKKVNIPDTLKDGMDENYIDFQKEMMEYGVKADKIMFCNFIDKTPEIIETIIDQQVSVFEIQHPDYMWLLSN